MFQSKVKKLLVHKLNEYLQLQLSDRFEINVKTCHQRFEDKNHSVHVCLYSDLSHTPCQHGENIRGTMGGVGHLHCDLVHPSCWCQGSFSFIFSFLLSLRPSTTEVEKQTRKATWKFRSNLHSQNNMSVDFFHSLIFILNILLDGVLWTVRSVEPFFRRTQCNVCNLAI